MSQIDTGVDRLACLAAWVEKYGYDKVLAASGYTSKRTIQQYISQERNPSWQVFHKIRRALGEKCA